MSPEEFSQIGQFEVTRFMRSPKSEKWNTNMAASDSQNNVAGKRGNEF
jgi:hypothetical protein